MLAIHLLFFLVLLFFFSPSFSTDNLRNKLPLSKFLPSTKKEASQFFFLFLADGGDARDEAIVVVAAFDIDALKSVAQLADFGEDDNCPTPKS
jgi:hypothetical protein